jgi:hypothetical protein
MPLGRRVLPAPVARILARAGRWPRRIAALACLVLSAGSALGRPTAPSAPHRHVAALHRGEVAVPVPIDPRGGTGLVRAGDQVGVLAAGDGTGPPSAGRLLADHVRVLSVRDASTGATAVPSGDASTVVVVATDRATAVELARFAGGRLLLIRDEFP